MESVESFLILDSALGRVVQVLTPSSQEWDRRQKLVDEHVTLLSRQLHTPHPVKISTFGSSLSGLCLANSDIDLGLFGRAHGCLLEDLRPSQQQGLLRLVLKAVHAAKLAKNQQVQAIWGARIPVLKYTCRLSGLDCDISLQGTGALVKANFIHILRSSSRQLSALYRLVKLWAQAHDLNDASRSTFNSTSLLYMTIFYLQQLQLLPPLQELVPQDLLLQPGARLLQGQNKQLWEQTHQLQQLLTAVQDRMCAWGAQQQQQQQQQPPGLGKLLLGFFRLWSGALTDWVLDRNRQFHADLWCGHWAPGSFMKQYIFSLQDPFDAADCPARAVGSSTNTNGGTAAFIAYMFSSSSKVMQRYTDSCSMQGSAAAAQDSAGRGAGWFEDWDQQSTSTAAAAVPVVRLELCKLVAWIFGPKSVLLMGCHEQQQQAVCAAAPWAAAPFPQSLVEAVQQCQRENMKPAKLLTWLVEQLEAELDKDRNILCLNHLGLLTRQISEAARAAAKQARGARHQGPQQQHPAAAAGTQLNPVADAVRQAVAAAGATSTSAERPSYGEAQQHAGSSSSIPLHGPCLQEPDYGLLNLQQQLHEDLANLQHKLRAPPGRTPPKRLPKAVRTAVQMSLAAVVRRIAQLQQLQGSSSSSNSGNDSSYGFLAVLQQHGFSELLEGWGLMTDGVVWEQVLPTEAPGHGGGSSSSSAADTQQQVQSTPVAVASQETAKPTAANGHAASVGAPASSTASTTAAAPASTASAAAAGGGRGGGNSSKSTQTLAQLLAPKGNSKGHPARAIKHMYHVVRTACQHQLAAAEAAGHGRSSQAAAMALAAAAAGQPRFTAAERPGPGGEPQWYAVVQLPQLVSVSTAADGSLTARQVIAPGTERVKLLRGGEADAGKVDTCARIIARDALKWLGSQPAVMAAVVEAVQLVDQQQDTQQQQQSQQQVTPEHVSCQGDLLPNVRRVAVRVVKVTQHQNGASSSVAATAVGAASDIKPNSTGSRSTVVFTDTSHDQQQQQGQQRRRGKQPQVLAAATAAEGGASNVVHGLATLTLADGVEDTIDAAEAVCAAHSRLQAVQGQIKHLEQRIAAKQLKLQADERKLEALQEEERQAAAAAARRGDGQASTSSSNHLHSTGAADAHGDLLLKLAMQQSLQEMLKQLRHDVNNAKSRVRNDNEALRQFDVNLRRLQQQKADATAALSTAEAQLKQSGAQD